MAFSFFGFGKQKSNEPTYQYAIKEMQAFFLEKMESSSDGGNYFLKQFLKKEIYQHSIGHLLRTFCGNIPTYDYYAVLHQNKYKDTLGMSFEEFFLTYGKEKTDDLLLDIKACFDANTFAAICSEGKWIFPSSWLYEACKDAGITQIDSDFARQKVMTIAKKILNDARVPAEYHALYVNRDLLEDIFKDGKKKTDAMDAIAKAEQRAPRQGTLREAERQLVVLSQRLHPLYGIDKRICMIEDAIEKINKKIYDYEEGQKAIRELGFILSTSVKQEKTKDWALLGGIVDGIAGPGAGMAAAVSAIIDNVEIERRNAQARQAANQTIHSIYADSSKMTTSIIDLENQRKLMQHYLLDAEIKVVMEQYSTDEIFKKLKVSSTVNKTKNGEGLQIAVTIKNNFQADVPENVQVVVDGTLSAKVFFEDTLLDTICVPLPLFGVSKQESVTVYTDYYVEAEGNYSVQFSPNKLWIVEI